MILIQCTQSKRSAKAKARTLYDESDLFVAMRDYAEATGEDYYILSAKHGLVDPETQIEPYDERGITPKQARAIAEEIATGPSEYVEIIAGKDYTNPLTPELEARGIEVLEVCRGQRIGERIQTLNRKRRELENEQLC
jgi:hypothetical protein